MSLSDADISFATELFSDLPDITTRKMFGGLAIYSEGQIFSLLRSDAQILIKANAGVFADRLAGMGCEIWTYARKNGAQSTMPYWTLPDAALDDPETACELARDALTALR